MGNLVTCGILVAEHTQDKHVQRDDEFYDGDNDNDHDMEDASWIPIPWLPEPLVTYYGTDVLYKLWICADRELVQISFHVIL